MIKLLVVSILLASLFANVLSERRSEVTQRRPRPGPGSRQRSVMRKSGPSGERQGRDRSTVVSCRVFRRGICPMANKILGSTGQTQLVQGGNSHGKCQQLCYATRDCSAFTFYRGPGRRGRRCDLFTSCGGKLGGCVDCISGPVMPRVSECLAARQVLPGKKKECSNATCTGVCVGPRCKELLEKGDRQLDLAEDDNIANDYDVNYTNNEESGDEDSTYDVYETEYTETDYTDTIDNVEAVDIIEEEAETIPEYDTNYEDPVSDEVEQIDFEDDNEVYDVAVDDTLEDEGLEEEEPEAEEVDMTIDEGLLTDDKGSRIDLPCSKTNVTIPTYIFYFCAIGGLNSGGAISSIDVLKSGQVGAFSIPPLPGSVTRGGGAVSASYTDNSILTCSQGFTFLSPYGFQYRPGSCYRYGLRNRSWQEEGEEMNNQRLGGAVVRVGRYLFAIGGRDRDRALRSVEVMDTRRPRRRWRRMSTMTLPGAAAEHCAIVMDGRLGKEIVVTGGTGRENRAMKVDLKTKRWYSLNRLIEGRRQHACSKVSLNGRPGFVVSGGVNSKKEALTSVEFYDAISGSWFSLPSLIKGRQQHQMTIQNGLLMVAGGEAVGRRGRKIYLDDTEVFNGKKWVKSRVKLDKPRSGFSLVKVPKKENLTDKRKGRRGQGSTRKKKESRRKKQSKSRRTQVRRPRKGYRRESTSRTSS